MSPACHPARVVALVPVCDGEHVLDACLDALLETDDGCDASQVALEVLVIDDGSRDASVLVAGRRADAGRLRVLALGRNHGFAGAINRGVAFALARTTAPDVLVLVNQDCVVGRGWLAPLLAALHEPAVAVAGARLLEADGVTLQHAGARVEANGLTSHIGRGCRDPLAYRQAVDADYVCGALLAMRTATWRRLGPFDEGYAPAYFEEVDFCRRARRHGLRSVYVPTSEAVHLEASCSGRGSGLYLRRYHRSRMRFVVHHLLGGGAGLRWLRAEAKWLAGLRRWSEIAPVVAAYARLPRLVAQRAGRALAVRVRGSGRVVVQAAETPR